MLLQPVDPHKISIIHPVSVCAEGEYQCDNDKCIAQEWRCDYLDDCGDFSDELDDACVCNLDFEFQCFNGGCVNATWVCDGAPDCLGGSDEANCTECAEGSYQCANGKCITEFFRCDYFDDCGDNSDEVDGCECQPEVDFECFDGGCVNATWVCDDEPDCLDGSDEVDELCDVVVPGSTEAPGTETTPGICFDLLS